MKLVIIGLLLISQPLLACPVFQGKYKCDNSSILTAKTEGNIYSFNSSNHWNLELIADGIRKVEDFGDGYVQTITESCGQSELVHFGEYKDNGLYTTIRLVFRELSNNGDILVQTEVKESDYDEEQHPLTSNTLCRKI